MRGVGPSWALEGYLRKVCFPGLAGSDPVGAFLREIEGVVAGPSRN
jgi:hypothetical protein